MRGWYILPILLVFSRSGAARSIQLVDRRGSEFDTNPSRVSNSNKGAPSPIECSLNNIGEVVKRVKRGAPKFLKNILGKIPGFKKLINKKKLAAGDAAPGTSAGTSPKFMAKVKAWLTKIGGKRAGKYAAAAVTTFGVGVLAAMVGRSNGGLPAMGMGGYGGLPRGWNAWRGH